MNNTVTIDLARRVLGDMPPDAALLDTVAAVTNCLLPRKVDVRRGDYHVILRKR
jgi:hypothetical protein